MKSKMHSRTFKALNILGPIAISGLKMLFSSESKSEEYRPNIYVFGVGMTKPLDVQGPLRKLLYSAI